MTTGERGYKTLAVRLEGPLHAQLTMLGQLTGRSVTEIMHTGIERFAAALSKQPEIANRAAEALAQIEQEAEARKSAIQEMFAQAAPPAASKPKRGKEATQKTADVEPA